jgi:hypothetical protein
MRLRPVGSAPFPLKNENAASGLLRRRTRANSMVIVHGYFAELRIRHRPRIRAEAEYGCFLARELLCECGAVCEVLMQNSLGCEMPSFLRPIEITLPTVGWSSPYRRAYPPTIPVAPTITRCFWSGVETFIHAPAALLISVMTEDAPPASRRRADAPQTAKRRLPLQTCRSSVARRSSAVASHCRQ